MRAGGLVLALSSLPAAAAFQMPLPDWLSENAIGWAAARGLQIGAASKDGSSVSRFVHLPISLLPLPFPRAAFEEAVEVAPVFNLLVDRVSRDDEWIKATLQEVRGS